VVSPPPVASLVVVLLLLLRGIARLLLEGGIAQLRSHLAWKAEKFGRIWKKSRSQIKAVWNISCIRLISHGREKFDLVDQFWVPIY
jgi:hypothetical protein